MNDVCYACANQEMDRDGDLQCGAADYKMTSDGYGPFKTGPVCVHDADTKDLFVLVDEHHVKDEEYRTKISNLNIALSIERDNVSKLQERLLKID